MQCVSPSENNAAATTLEKRLCDVFDNEVNRIAEEVGSRKKAFQLAKADHKLVRFYLPLVPDDPEQPVWSVNHGKLWKSLMRAHLANYEAAEARLRKNESRPC